MTQSEKQWHPRFLKYIEEIVKHPNYKGLPIKLNPRPTGRIRSQACQSLRARRNPRAGTWCEKSGIARAHAWIPTRARIYRAAYICFQGIHSVPQRRLQESSRPSPSRSACSFYICCPMLSWHILLIDHHH